MDVDNEYQVGWVCPKCGRVLAPWMSECPCYYIHAPLTDVGVSTPTSSAINANRVFSPI